MGLILKNISLFGNNFRVNTGHFGADGYRSSLNLEAWKSLWRSLVVLPGRSLAHNVSLVARIRLRSLLGLILGEVDWTSHLGRSPPDDISSDWCGVHRLNTPTSRCSREIDWTSCDGKWPCCFVDSCLFIKQRGTWWNPNRYTWHENDNFISHVESERKKWRKGRALQVGVLQHKMNNAAWTTLGSGGAFTRRESTYGKCKKIPNP